MRTFSLSYLQKMADEVRRQGLDAILIAPSEDLLFITGHNPIFCERFQGLFVKADGDYFYVCNLLTQEEMEDILPNRKVYSWFDGDGFQDAVRTALEENGLIGKTIGVNATVRAFNLLEISEAVDVHWVSARYLPQEIRIRKTDREIDGMREAARIAEKALEKTLASVRPGITEGEVKELLLRHMIEFGGKNPRSLVAAGPNGGYPHYNLGLRTLQKGDAIVIDFGCEYDLVRTDITRTIFLGEPTAKQREVYDLVRRANEAAEAIAGEGAWIPDLDEAARKVITDGGYGPYFTTRLGHGIGFLGHEAPDIKKNNRRHLEPRMSFTIEPGIYLGGEFGVRIEDCVVILPNGKAEILHHFTKDYVIIDC